ncbi:glycosyl hydrolase family 28-related protein [Moraxella atlantae]|uniref:right-handed parallel beta-helix repeat-containing protein n=1 Tax=Faucicola atlantae TaxID=34059 RepID=UPI003751D677
MHDLKHINKGCCNYNNSVFVSNQYNYEIADILKYMDHLLHHQNLNDLLLKDIQSRIDNTNIISKEFNDFKNKISQNTNNVKLFGAKGDGKTDDTAAIQKCIDSCQSVFFPTGNYLISNPLIQKFSGQKFYGEGTNPYNDHAQGSRIIQTNSSASVFKSTETGFSANDLNITYSDTPNSGAVFDITHSGSSIYNIWIDKCWKGFSYERNTGHYLTHVNVQSAYYAGFYVKGTNDIAVSNSIFVSADLGNKSLNQQEMCPNGVVVLEGYVQAVQFTNVDILGGCKSFGVLNTSTDPSSINNLAAFCKFTNVYFDSSFFGADIDRCVGMTFTNCWFSNRPSNGATVGKTFTDNIKFIGCNFENCGSSGVVLHKNSKHTLFNSCSFLGNSTIDIGKHHGAFVESDTNDFSFIDCIFKNVDYFGSRNSQEYGLFLNGGNTNRFKLVGNDFRGNNQSAGLLCNHQLSPECTIAFNQPQKSDATTYINLPAGSNTYTYTNNSGMAQVIAIRNGEVSKITLFGSPVYTETNKVIPLPNGQSVSITYSEKPDVNIGYLF